MKLRLDAASSAWAGLRRQWAERVVLRLGIVTVLALLALNGLWWHQDRLAARAKDIDSLQAELQRMRSLQSGPAWAIREQEASTRLAALHGMTWQESTPGLAQAAFQDWLAQAATKAGLQLREMRLGTNDPAPARSAGKPATGTESASIDGKTARARLVVDFKPQALASFLHEMASSPRAVMVDRLQVRTWTPAPQAELDVRIEIRSQGNPP